MKQNRSRNVPAKSPKNGHLSPFEFACLAEANTNIGAETPAVFKGVAKGYFELATLNATAAEILSRNPDAWRAFEKQGGKLCVPFITSRAKAGGDAKFASKTKITFAPGKPGTDRDITIEHSGFTARLAKAVLANRDALLDEVYKNLASAESMETAVMLCNAATYLDKREENFAAFVAVSDCVEARAGR